MNAEKTRRATVRLSMISEGTEEDEVEVDKDEEGSEDEAAPGSTIFNG